LVITTECVDYKSAVTECITIFVVQFLTCKESAVFESGYVVHSQKLLQIQTYNAYITCFLRCMVM